MGAHQPQSSCQKVEAYKSLITSPGPPGVLRSSLFSAQPLVAGSQMRPVANLRSGKARAKVSANAVRIRQAPGKVVEGYTIDMPSHFHDQPDISIQFDNFPAPQPVKKVEETKKVGFFGGLVQAFSKANFIGDDIYTADAISAHHFQPKPEPPVEPKMAATKVPESGKKDYVDFYIQPSKMLDDRVPQRIDTEKVQMAKKQPQAQYVISGGLLLK